MLDALRPRAAKIVRTQLRGAPQLWRELIAFAPDQTIGRAGGHTF
jgi:hypothetical protein